MLRKTKAAVALSLCAAISACGTTFQLPDTSGHDGEARQLFADARSAQASKPISEKAARRRFSRVQKRVAPVGKKLCAQLTAERRNFNCDVSIEIDEQLAERNAYFTYDKGAPVIRMSMPILRDFRNDHEVAFVMGHEYGHLIGRHIEKSQQQAVVGALILGSIAAAASAQSAAYGGHYDHGLVSDSVDIGAAIGDRAYSQTYELESDSIGTHIAHAAGYDPVLGARYFAKPEQPTEASGQRSFWGTHPPDEKRMATVLATQAEIDAGTGLKRAQ